MFKLVVVTLFVLCTLKSGLAIKCFLCSDCATDTHAEVTCPSTAPNCGTYTVNVDIENYHTAKETKGCFPDLNGRSCAALIEETIDNSGFFTKKMLEYTKQAFKYPGVKLDCHFCKDKDLCNSSSVVMPSVLTFLVLAILAKLF